MPLAGNLGDNVAIGRNDNKCGPGAYAVRVPYPCPFIKYDRMCDAISFNGVHYVFVLALIVEFGAVNANDHERLSRVFPFKVFQVWNDVHAVNTAIRPEIEQYDVAAQ